MTVLLGTRIKEHQKKNIPNPTAVADHCATTLHNISSDNVSVIAKEDKFWSRKIREAVEILWEDPNLNRDHGYELPAIYKQLTPRQ